MWFSKVSITLSLGVSIQRSWWQRFVTFETLYHYNEDTWPDQKNNDKDNYKHKYNYKAITLTLDSIHEERVMNIFESHIVVGITFSELKKNT